MLDFGTARALALAAPRELTLWWRLYFTIAMQMSTLSRRACAWYWWLSIPPWVDWATLLASLWDPQGSPGVHGDLWYLARYHGASPPGVLLWGTLGPVGSLRIPWGVRPLIIQEE